MHKLVITPRPAPAATAVDGPALQLRSKVFETNSSSSHSLTLSAELLTKQPLPPEVLRAGVLKVTGGEYGWEWYRYYLPVNKINYLAAQALQDMGSDVAGDAQTARQTSPAFDLLCEVVESHTGCKVELSSFQSEIDHDSVGCCDDVLKDRDALHRLIFDADSYVETGNDNSSRPWEIQTDKGSELALHRQFRQTPADFCLVSFRSCHPVGRLQGLWFERPGERRGSRDYVLISHLVNPDLAQAILADGVLHSVTLVGDRTHREAEKGELALRGLDVMALALNVPADKLALSACLDTQHRHRQDASFRTDVELGICLPKTLCERILEREDTPIALADYADLVDTMESIKRYNGGVHPSDKEERFSALARKHPGLAEAVAAAIAAGSAQGSVSEPKQGDQPGDVA